MRKLNKYIYGAVTVLLITLAGCSDDIGFDRDEQQYSSEYLSFSAVVSSADDALTRSGEYVPYEPLVLNTGDDDFPLYLHTYAHPMGDEDVAEESEATRGLEVTSAKDLYDIHKSFAVRGDLNDAPYITMQNTKTVGDSDERKIWTTESTHRWPGNEYLSFNAIAPFSHLNKLENPEYGENQISFSYTAQKGDGSNDAEMQTDLLMATATMNREGSKDYNHRIPLRFNHALSAIKFAVRDVLKGKVVSVSIKGINSKGDCVFTADPNSENGSFTWTNQSGIESGSYTQLFNHAIEDGYANRDDESKDVVLNDKMPEKTFMVIPQEIPDDAIIEAVIEREGVNPAQITVRGKIKANELTEWLPGHEYIYTISTSASNWTYVFNVNGSYRNNTEIYMPSPADDEIYKTYTDGGGTNRPYYEVVSYRYRTNNQTVRENLPWTASHGDGNQYYYTKFYQTFQEKDKILYLNRERESSERAAVPAATWLTDLHATPLRGNGSVAKERHNLSFLSPIVTTDWQGDVDMYKKSPYAGNSESNPWDLSTFGGQTSRNTANCYIVDREGWYAIPLYYGNAVKNGAANSGAWKTSASDLTKTNGSVTYRYYALSSCKDCKNARMTGNSLATARIPSSYYNSAHLLWQDTYDVIDNVKLATVNGEQMIVFHVNKNNLQQGNALIGLSEHTSQNFNVNDPKIVWSWHIWFNEHWLNDRGISNAFNSSGFNTGINPVNQMQQQGDLQVTVPRTTTDNRQFYVAPYNIGWCDAKNVRYLSRYNTMGFVQYEKDGSTKSGKTAQLPIIQDGRTIQYHIGNNVYFQFGRKDPFVGFIDYNSELKPKYGTLKEYLKQPQLKSIPYSIQNPHILFVGGAALATNNEWNAESDWNNSSTQQTEFYTLWNNTAYNKTESNNAGQMTDTEFFTSQKTIYDPSPAGYMVPPSGFFKILFKNNPGSYNENSSSYSSLTAMHAVLNGYKFDATGSDNISHPIYRIYTSRSSTATFFSLTSTGHRWYSDTEINGKHYGPGDNFNPDIAYLWSSNVTKSATDRSAYSMALGYDTGNGKYIISSAFNGRKSMARPIRCVRE